MKIHFTTIFVILLASQAHLSILTNNPITLRFCTASQALLVQILLNPHNETSCQCQAGRAGHILREDYTYTRGIGMHKIHTIAKTWNEARRICMEENAHLAIINSKAEEAVLLDMLKKNSHLIMNSTNKQQAFLGIHDLFKEEDWTTVFGESLLATGFSEWSTNWYGPQPDNQDNNQNCGALVIKGGMDDVNCNLRFAFFCELSLACE